MSPNQPDISPLIREKAPLILAEIRKAKSVLLHCHPSPDPDSVGSALAMKFALEQMGKKATVIRGDSEMPQAYRHFPGAHEIVPKSFGELDLKDFDLFIMPDTASETQVSRYHTPVMPLPLRTIVIDHHATNRGFADINLIVPSSPATCQILFELFKILDIKIDRNIASNLFAGLYTDTGGFKYPDTNDRTFEIASELVRIVPDFTTLISKIENTNTPAFIAFSGMAQSSVESFHNGKLALAAVSYQDLKSKNIPISAVNGGEVASLLRTVPEWKVIVVLTEPEQGKIRLNSRSLDGDTYDVSKLMSAFGGGGHKASAGATISGMAFDEAKRLVVAKAKELYNL